MPTVAQLKCRMRLWKACGDQTLHLGSQPNKSKRGLPRRALFQKALFHDALPPRALPHRALPHKRCRWGAAIQSAKCGFQLGDNGDLGTMATKHVCALRIKCRVVCAGDPIEAKANVAGTAPRVGGALNPCSTPSPQGFPTPQAHHQGCCGPGACSREEPDRNGTKINACTAPPMAARSARATRHISGAHVRRSIPTWRLGHHGDGPSWLRHRSGRCASPCACRMALA